MCLGRVDQQQDGHVGHQPLHDVQVQLEHVLDADAARDPLVRERRVDVPVGDHVGPTLERRPDHGRDQLGAGGGEQRRLGPRRHLRAVEDELPHPLADLRATRFAGRHHLAPFAGERVVQELRLRRLARPVHSLEGHEHAAPTIRR